MIAPGLPGCEIKRVPIDSDLHGAQEPAKVDNGGVNPAIPADDDVYDRPISSPVYCERPCRE